MKILVLNGGSSSLKATLRELGTGPLPETPTARLWEAQAEWGRQEGKAHIRVSGPEGSAFESEIEIASPEGVIEPLLEKLWSGPAKAVDGRAHIDMAGHRVVHGGKSFRESTRITPEVLKELRKVREFAPVHNQLEIHAIQAVENLLGLEVPQVAVFDTAFHATMPRAATVYPVPFEWDEQGIRRYGFHGISHRYSSRRAASVLGRDPCGLRLVTCHLGNGASLAAVCDGRSVDTTMGFTPLEGLMMGTRSGSIDPGVLIYLVRHRGYSADALERILNKESGLLAVSGVSGDMREVQAAIERGEERARLAFDVYVHRLCRETGGMVASLGGIDALVFTAGVGENSPQVREAVCGQLGFLGIELDNEMNRQPCEDRDIAAAGSAVRVVTIRAEEDWEIARECYLLGCSSARPA